MIVDGTDESSKDDLFAQADWYDRSIDWSARLERELPVLRRVLGSPGAGGVLDAGCGPGRHAIALAKLGYRMTCADADEGMLKLAARAAERARVSPTIVHATYEYLADRTPGG